MWVQVGTAWGFDVTADSKQQSSGSLNTITTAAVAIEPRLGDRLPDELYR